MDRTKSVERKLAETQEELTLALALRPKQGEEGRGHSYAAVEVAQQQQRVRQLQRRMREIETELKRRQHPIVTITDVQQEGLARDIWSQLQFGVCNEGYGPAHDLTVRAAGDLFDSQTADTPHIPTLETGSKYVARLDVCPHEHGDDVPLRLCIEYEDHTGTPHTRERTIRLRVGESGSSPVPIQATRHVLSFTKLSPLNFERLCLWLVEREGYERGEHLGLVGSEQGRDVVAYKPTPQGEELWYFQCKRYRSISASVLEKEVDKYLELAQEKPHLWPKGVVFVVSCAVPARVRDQVSEYCEQQGLACEFWASTELDMRVKRHPVLLKEFFNLTP